MSIGHMQEQALRAAREGRSIRRYLADTTVTNAFVVQVAATDYYDIPEGKQVVITRLHIGCETVDEFAAGYLVACAEITGGGVATQLHAQAHDHVGSKKEWSGHIVRTTNPPIVVKYSDGYRSVSLAVKATDNTTVVSYGWNGWLEDEGTLS